MVLMVAAVRRGGGCLERVIPSLKHAELHEHAKLAEYRFIL
jgi:hypothetical protein